MAERGNKLDGFTMLEVLIMVIILSILSLVVVPKFGVANEDAQESRLLTDVNSVRRVVQIYKLEHNGKLPHVDHQGKASNSELRARLLGKTTPDGTVDESGTCGPYLRAWPENPFMEGTRAQAIKFGSSKVGPRDGVTGWYYSTSDGSFWPNSKTGGDSLFTDGEVTSDPGGLTIPSIPG